MMLFKVHLHQDKMQVKTPLLLMLAFIFFSCPLCIKNESHRFLVLVESRRVKTFDRKCNSSSMIFVLFHSLKTSFLIKIIA